MEAEPTRRISRALEGALAVFRDAKGRLSASDIRVQSIIATIRSALVERTQPESIDWPGTPATRSPFRPLWDDRPPEKSV